MKRDGILHPQLLEVVGSLGHLDEIVVSDAGLPIPADVRRIDLAYAPGRPPFFEVLEAIAGEIVVDTSVIASEASDGFLADVARVLDTSPASIERVGHDAFKRRTARARAIVRTGEFTPYANVILVCGVAF